jgi:hypothetical protein
MRSGTSYFSLRDALKGKNMKSKSFLLVNLFLLAACIPAMTQTVESASTTVPPTATLLSPAKTPIPPTETSIPPTATPVPEYERLSPTAIRVNGVVITADAVLSPEKFELTYNWSIPVALSGKVISGASETTFKFPEGPEIVLQPNYGGGGGGGGDQGYETGSAMQGYLVKTTLESGQLVHLIAYATLDPSTGVTEPVPFEFYLLVQ